MSSPRCCRLAVWEPMPGLPGMIQISLQHGHREFSTLREAQSVALASVTAGAAKADIWAIFARSRKLVETYKPHEGLA